MPPRPNVGHAPFTRSTAPACRRTGPGAGTLRWKQRARGPRIGRGPAPRSRGAGPERPARSTRWRGGPLQPTGPRLRPTSTNPVPLLASRAEVLRPRPRPIARCGPTHGADGRSAQVVIPAGTVAAEAPGATASIAPGCPRSTGRRPRMDTRGHPEPRAPCGSRHRRRRHAASPPYAGARTGEDPRRYSARSPLDTLHVCAVICRSSTSIVDEANRRRESC